MNCDANIQTIINKQKELIDTIDNYNYYVFCAKVGDSQLIGDNIYDFNTDDSGSYEMHNSSAYGGWPQSLIDISSNLRDGCKNSALLGLTHTSINTKIAELELEIDKLEEHSDCSDKIQEIRDKHIELMNKKQQVLNLTAQYESDPSSMLKQSELQLDSTIYASILWSTVAAGLLYYVFVDI